MAAVCSSAGDAGVVPLHSHYAIQVAFGEQPGLAFRPSEIGEWTLYGGALIPSRQPHSMDASRVRGNAVMFVEPETREGRILNERYCAAGIAPMPDETYCVTADVFRAWMAGNTQGIIDASARVIRSLTGDVFPKVESDERILRAIDYINRNLAGKLTLEEVAEQAFLSPGRFRHLFVEQTGLGLRPYVLWRRFLKVWELASRGYSLSAAAHAAGFADAAHLSRTSRRMFGIAPTALRFSRPDETS